MGFEQTDSNGEAFFIYAASLPAGPGTDVIQACITTPLGNNVCHQVKKTWIGDITPPIVACFEGTNPAGRTPRARNEDGFFIATAVDLQDPNPEVFIVDTGSGNVFGSYVSGVNFKYVEANGARKKQKEKKGPGAVDVRLKGTGDLAVYAVDAAGNQSADALCFVPPPPKSNPTGFGSPRRGRGNGGRGRAK